MGMSASQARYLSLTERMNDIEYQGQQINQQRTTLSNQVNALYASLEEMDVPTPPSSKDYQKVTYEGSLGASKYTVDSKDIVPKANNKYSITMSMKSYGNTVSKNTGYATVENSTGVIKGQNLVPEVINAQKFDASQGLTMTPSSDGVSWTEFSGQISPENYNTAWNSNKDVIVQKGSYFYQVGRDKAFNHEDGVTVRYGYYQYYDPDSLMTREEAEAAGIRPGNEGVPTNGGDLVSGPGGKVYTAYKKETITPDNADQLESLRSKEGFQPADGNPNNEYVAPKPEKTTLKPEYSAVYEVGNGTKLYQREMSGAQEGIKSSSLSTTYIKEDDGIRMATTSDFFATSDGNYYILKYDKSKYITTTAGDTAYNMSGASDVSVNGHATYTFNELPAAGYSEETISKFKDAISNSGICDANGKNYTWESFYLVFNGNGTSPSFVLKEDLTDGNDNCELYDYQPNGSVDIRSTLDDCVLTFDVSTGQITSIGIPKVGKDGKISYTTVKMAATVETDDVALKEAYSQYEYKKLLYDQEQNEINKKTSIIQAEDKSLELKLTRLDNERNAVKTEMDAVKKVIDENIEKSYKTFSG